jgi:hypothetical protein
VRKVLICSSTYWCTVTSSHLTCPDDNIKRYK